MQSTSISTSSKAKKPDSESIEDKACAIFDGVFSSSGTSRSNVLQAFETSLGNLLEEGGDRESRLRDISKAAALSTARCHGNIIETGRTLLGSVDELGAKLRLDVRRCKDQVMLGLAEGACQIGPIVYGRYLDIASEYRDNADDWIAKNKRRAAIFEAHTLPVIVPFEADLTLSSKPFRSPETFPIAGLETFEPLAEPLSSNTTPLTSDSSLVAETSTQPDEPPSSDEPPAAPTAQWSRPKGKGIFQRLSDVMGSFFGRS